MWFEWWLNLATFAGIATLSIPVWSLNFRKKDAVAARRAADTVSGPRKVIKRMVHARKQAATSDWHATDEVCLILGYGLLLGSTALRVWISFPA